MKRIIALAIGLAITAPATGGISPEPYCVGYIEVLQDAVAKYRQGYPNYSRGLPVQEWRDGVNFIFSKPKDFDYSFWISEQHRTCLRETPYGPKQQQPQGEQ